MLEVVVERHAVDAGGDGGRQVVGVDGGDLHRVRVQVRVPGEVAVAVVAHLMTEMLGFTPSNLAADLLEGDLLRHGAVGAGVGGVGATVLAGHGAQGRVQQARVVPPNVGHL